MGRAPAAYVLAVVLATACAPAVSAPPPTAPATTAVPSATALASAAPSTRATPIPLPNTATLSARGDVVWMLVAGTHLFRSTDRGGTWDERTLPPGVAGVTDIAFASASDGMLLAAAPPATQCQAQAALLWSTRDGAASWRSFTTNSLAESGCKDALAVADGGRAFVTVGDPNHPPVVYRFGAGDDAWRAASLPDPPGFTTAPGGVTLRAGRVHVFDRVALIAAVGQASGRQARFVFRSDDSGASWRFAATAPTAEDVVFVTATRWLQIGTPNASRETTDGGASWHAFATDYTQAAPIAPQLAFGDAETGYATVRGGLSRTIDGGAHWSAVRTPGT